MRESFPRQVDKKSRGPQGERGLGYSRRKKGQTLFPLHSLGLYNNNVSCLRTVFGLNLLANSVILKCKLWEWVWWGLCSLQTFYGFIGEYITPLLILAKGYSFAPFWCLCQKLSLSLYTLIKLDYKHTQKNKIYFKNDHMAQDNLQIQCNPYQITNGTFPQN